jgi:hypothetical protein
VARTPGEITGTKFEELPAMREHKAGETSTKVTNTERLIGEYTARLDELNAKLAKETDTVKRSVLERKKALIQKQLSRLTSEFGSGVSGEEADSLMADWMEKGG